MPMLAMFSSRQHHRTIGLFFSCFFIFAITGLRHNVGYDYEAYVVRYFAEVAPREPLSNLIFNFSLIFDNSDIYFLIYALLTAIALFFVSKKESNPWIIVNFYFLPWFFIESMTLVRQFGALTFCILAYYHYSKNNKAYLYLTGFVGILCHYSSIPFVAILFALKQSSSFLLKVIILCLTAVIFYYQGIILEFWLGGLGIFDFYQKGNTHGSKLLILYLLFFLLSFQKEGKKDASYIIFIGLVANMVLIGVDSTLTRLTWYFLIPFLWFKWNTLFYFIKVNNPLRVMFVILLVMLFSFSLYIKSNDPLSKIIPYRNIITEKYL